MSLSKSSKIICIIFIFIIIINRIIFFTCFNPNINEAFQSSNQRLKDKKTKRLEKEKKEQMKKGRQTDWGVDYHGSVLFDNYYMPQINLKPAYLFFDSDYYTY
jgi:hypothetical protein